MLTSLRMMDQSYHCPNLSLIRAGGARRVPFNYVSSVVIHAPFVAYMGRFCQGTGLENRFCHSDGLSEIGFMALAAKEVKGSRWWGEGCIEKLAVLLG